MLELRGFSVERGRLLLSDGSIDGILERAFVDLQRWDRWLHRNAADFRQRLPTKRLRKLMAVNWVRGDAAKGWRVEYKKTLSVCEQWLNAAFIRLPQEQQREFLDDGLYVTAKRRQAEAREESKHARDLQQYFTSSPLVERVLKLVRERLQSEENVVWLEPSCGDGRFLTALLRDGARRVVGFEIDERVQRVAEQQVQKVLTVAGSDGAQAEVHRGDFLTSTRTTALDEFVVAIGNPPFGARGGDGSDLVHHFFRHAAIEWRARVVAFIVPERCSRPSFVETTLLQLNEAGSAAWTLSMQHPLTDFEFEFGAGDALKRVRQPSVLQLFSRGNVAGSR